MGERTVGTRDLKNRLSEYLRRVKSGETIIITERGKPVGQIVPIQDDSTERMMKLVEAGLAEWNGQPVPASEPKAVNRGPGLVSDLIIQDRE